MHDERFARRQAYGQVLAAAAHLPDVTATQSIDKLIWKRNAQVGAIEDHAPEPRALHRRFQHPAHGLDFGKLGHCHRLNTDWTQIFTGLTAIARAWDKQSVVLAILTCACCCCGE